MNKKLLTLLAGLALVGAGCLAGPSEQAVPAPVDSMMEEDSGEKAATDGESMMVPVEGEEVDEMIVESDAAMKDDSAEDSAMVDTGTHGAVVQVEMAVRQWEFVPSEIRAKEGDTVRLIITNEDVAHGIGIPTLGVNEPIGAGETVTVEFVADKKGAHNFFCNVYCGNGHRDMVGKIIVE